MSKSGPSNPSVISLTRSDLNLASLNKPIDKLRIYDFSFNYSREQFSKASKISFTDNSGEIKIFKER